MKIDRHRGCEGGVGTQGRRGEVCQRGRVRTLRPPCTARDGRQARRSRFNQNIHGAAGARRASGGRVSLIALLGRVGRSAEAAEDHVGPKARLASAEAAGLRQPCTIRKRDLPHQETDPGFAARRATPSIRVALAGRRSRLRLFSGERLDNRLDLRMPAAVLRSDPVA